MIPPMILIHGFAGGPSSWDPVVAALAPGGEVVRVTLSGHGGRGRPGVAVSRERVGQGRGPELAQRPRERLVEGARGSEAGKASSFEREVDAIAELLRACDVGPAHLCGYSLGARVGLGLLARHPGLFQRATLIGVNPGLGSPAERQARISADQRWIELLETQPLECFLDAWEAQPLFESQRRLPEAVRARFRAQRLRLDPVGLAHSLRTLGAGRMPDYHPILPQIQLPVQLVCGASDHRFLGFAVQMAGRLPRPSLRIVPDAGHNVVLEQPLAVAALLMEGMAYEQPGRVEAGSGL